MELRYNLTPQDFKRGMILHARRPRGPLGAVRKVERMIFLLFAVAAGVVSAMLLVILAAGRWEEDFNTVLVSLAVTLAVSLGFLWLLSPGRQAASGVWHLQREGGYFGPRTLMLTEEGVAVTYGVNRRVEPYSAIEQVWEKKGFVLLYLKYGPWEVLPPCAFSGPEERAAFLSCLEEGRQGRPPEAENPPGRVEELPEEGAAFRLTYTWTPEELQKTLLAANQAYIRTRLYWRPAAIVVGVLSVPVLLLGILVLLGVLVTLPEEGISGLLRALGILLLGIGMCLRCLSFVPGVMAWSIRRQEKKGELRHLLAGQLTETIGDSGVYSLRAGERERTLWSQVGAVRSADWGLALFRYDRKLLVFPARAFSGREEQERAAEYARARIGRKS